jgi:hypothetical protein
LPFLVAASSARLPAIRAAISPDDGFGPGTAAGAAAGLAADLAAGLTVGLAAGLTAGLAMGAAAAGLAGFAGILETATFGDLPAGA